MMRCNLSSCWMIVAAAWVSPAFAQEKAQRSGVGIGSMMNFQMIAESYGKVLVRKYNLNEEQDEFTQKMLREKTERFLANHEDEIRVLIDRLFDARTGGDISPAELIAWGKRAQPIYDDAREIIISGNDEWREILTEEQRRIHDQDLKLMWESFARTEDQLGRIVTGEMSIEDFRNPRRPRTNSRPRTTVTPKPQPPPQTLAPKSPPVVRAQPRTIPPTRPNTRSTRSTDRQVRPQPPTNTRTKTPRRGSSRSSTKTAGNFEGKWDAYTKDFIEKHQLNDDQKQKALTILQDCKDKAKRVMLKNKPRIAKLDQQNEALKSSKDKDRGQRMAEIVKKKLKFLEPVNLIFEKDLKPRLDKLPTRAQRRAAQAATKNTKGRSSSKRKSDDKDK
ncbi:MAG: hypothetical protein IH986_15055 [Planctomycetes bacterium]|nr:hypothetical protein [Planctomycetota bacterium]